VSYVKGFLKIKMSGSKKNTLIIPFCIILKNILKKPLLSNLDIGFESIKKGSPRLKLRN
jgi:hypothetical protein